MDQFNFNPGCGGTGGDGCDCGDCEEWRRYCYWNHDHGHTKQFLLFASDEKDYLCIPWEVTSQLRNMITDSEPIKLEAPDGQMYSVEFVKFGPITLTTGWRRFVDANHIRQGDPILFVYCGGSSFKVHICSSSGPENSLPCSQQPPNIFRAVPPRDRHVLNEQVVPDPAHVRMSTDFGYTMFPGTWLTKAQEKKVLELADSGMGSEIPLHVAAMNKRNANEDYYVYIPLRLLDNFKDTIQLEAHGNNMVYDVGASKQSDDQIILQSELSDFVASHGIQDNDLLVFRSKGKARLEVLVLDPSGCEKTSCFAMANSSNAQEVCEDLVEIIDPPPHTVTDTDIDLISDDDEVVEEGTASLRREQRPLRGCRAKAQQMASTSSPCTKSGHKAGKSNEAGLEAPMPNKPYILPEGMKLTSQQEEKVKEKVRAIGSEFPVFVKVMKAHDVLKPTQLLFCMEYASACLPLEQTPLLLGLEGSEMQWPTALVINRYTNARRISLLWRNFVSVSGMKAGDICLVELVDRSSERLTMTVHLIRESEMLL